MNIQERADRLVRNEVYVCLSSLVSTLAKGYGEIQPVHNRHRDVNELHDLCEQAFELCTPVPDYEEAARQAGAAFSVDWTAQQACDALGIDPYEREIFEHWAISQHLADDLIALGERVDTDFANMCVWGRTTTGQGIAQDGVIREVLALHDRRLAEMRKGESMEDRLNANMREIAANLHT